MKRDRIKINGAWITLDDLTDQVLEWGPWMKEYRDYVRDDLWYIAHHERPDGYAYARALESEGYEVDSALVRLFDEIREAVDDNDNGFYIEGSGWARKFEGATK